MNIFRHTLPRNIIQLCTVLLFVKQSWTYSWYSTVWEMRQLLETDRILAQELTNVLMSSRAAVSEIITHIENINATSSTYLGTTYQNNSQEISRDQHMAWLNQKISDLQRIILPLNYTHSTNMKILPKQIDMKATLKVLLDLQTANNLSTKNLAKGYIVNTATAPSLSGTACYHIAVFACNQYSQSLCTEWTEAARERIQAENRTLNLLHLTDTKETLQLYSQLCSASVNQSYITNASNPKLKCFLWDNYGNPRLILQPVRTEILSVEPLIVTFYNVISDRDADYMLSQARSKLRVATTNLKEDSIDIQNTRVTHTCFLNSRYDTLLKKLDASIQDITGLPAVTQSEFYQLANYGIGGHYEPHLDSNMDLYHRKATFLYYLSDVEYGGATAFLGPEIAVKPEKNAAVFWHNLDKDSGPIDGRTVHAACPVLLGNKWIANKWIRDAHSDVCVEHKYQL